MYKANILAVPLVSHSVQTRNQAPLDNLVVLYQAVVINKDVFHPPLLVSDSYKAEYSCAAAMQA